MLSRHALKPYDDLTAVTWSERLARLLVIAESADRLLVVSPAGAIDADLPLPGGQQEGLAVAARRRALGRRREAGLAALPGRRDGALANALAVETGDATGAATMRRGARRCSSRPWRWLAQAALGRRRRSPTRPPGWVAKPFSLEKPSADFRIALKGYVQADFRSYHDWTAEDADGTSALPPEFEWQRSRLGLEGRWRRLSFEVDVEPAFDETDELKDAWIEPARRRRPSGCAAAS